MKELVAFENGNGPFNNCVVILYIKAFILRVVQSPHYNVVLK